MCLALQFTISDKQWSALNGFGISIADIKTLTNFVDLDVMFKEGKAYADDFQVEHAGSRPMP